MNEWHRLLYSVDIGLSKDHSLSANGIREVGTIFFFKSRNHLIDCIGHFLRC